MRNPISWTGVARRASVMGAAVLLAALAAPPVHAQAGLRRDVIRSQDGSPDYTLRKKPASISLFSFGDLAGSGMKMTGQMGWIVSNLGPCSDGFELGECGDIFTNGGYQFQWFGLNILAGAGPHDFNKIASVYPAITSQVKPAGYGYTALYNFILFSGRSEIGPADNTLGHLFSGASSTSDGSCRDNTSPLNGYMTTGVSLLAGSTCPETWSIFGFQGPRPVPVASWQQLYNQNPNTFTFDYWRVPAGLQDTTGFLGDFATYGAMSDHYDEILNSYGAVTPLRPGAQVNIGGYPLGLDFHFDAFSYSFGPINNTVFWRMTVVNNSEKVYGKPVDYDSLYLGLESSPGGTQNNAIYYRSDNNTVYFAQNGVHANCNNSTNPTGVSGCTFPDGLSNGGAAVIVLKSPIGDMRNKLFTRSGPFHNPSNIHAGDTLTFNHGHMCGFGSCWSNTWNTNDRRGFGMMSSTPANVLDGRAPTEPTATEFWRDFRNVDFPARTAQFPAYVPPGGWDYNHDGIPDTLHLDTCASNGCVGVWSDTMPGKQNNRVGNVGGVITAGPFKLKAGDTTSWIFAVAGGVDSTTIQREVDAAITTYLGFFTVPKPPPVPAVTNVDVMPTEAGAPQVTLHYTNAPSVAVDPFLTLVAQQIRNGTDSATVQLRTLNPALADTVLARAQHNFSALWIFKSCDNGTTFTADNTCRPAPSVTPQGTPIGAGWRPYAILPADENGDVPTVFTDANVIGGKTYLYSFVTRSKGLTVPIKVVVNGDTIATDTTFVDTATSALQRSGPSVAKVYVPISTAAGAAPATVAISSLAGTSEVPVNVSFGSKVTGGTYKMYFGNRFIIQTLTSASTGALRQVKVTVQDVAPHAKPSSGGAAQSDVVLDQQTFTGTGAVQFTGDVSGSGSVTSNDTTFTSDTISALGFVLATAGGTPLFVSTTLTPTGTTPANFVNRPDFPGFIVGIDASAGGQLAYALDIEPGNDTVPGNIVNSSAVAWQPGAATLNGPVAYGERQFRFQDDPFGPGVPFRLTTFDSVQAAVTASLAGRQNPTTGDASPATLAAVRAALDDSTVTLVAGAKFPFSVVNTATGQAATLAMFPTTGKLLLGSGNDTMTVSVPADVWLPGDPFAIIEQVSRDSMIGDTVVLGADGKPVQTSTPVVTFANAVLGCNSPRVGCNPLALNTRGATGYLPLQKGATIAINYTPPFTPTSVVQLTVTPPVIVPQTLTKGDLSKILVVPNPYVVQSQFDQGPPNGFQSPRILFTGVPASGSLWIYSVSGQFLQRLDWTPADLNGTGDLAYDLKTREGLDLGAGLYIYVIKAKDSRGHEQTARGKFVVIR